MKKALFICSLLLSLSIVNAQTIESGSRNTAGYIKSDGTIENKSHSTVGYIKSDGTVENKSHSTIGRIKNDGTIENKSGSTVGYVKKDGTVENSSHPPAAQSLLSLSNVKPKQIFLNLSRF